jgi:hypothetical protein
MICYHSINGITNNNLKGASMMNQNQELLFNQKDIDFINQVLKVSGYAVSRLNPQTEEHKRIINNVGQSLKIISAKTNKNKQKQGAQSFEKVRDHFGFSNSNNNISQSTKGASQQQQINNNNICNKKKSLINIREHFNLV